MADNEADKKIDTDDPIQSTQPHHILSEWPDTKEISRWRQIIDDRDEMKFGNGMLFG